MASTSASSSERDPAADTSVSRTVHLAGQGGLDLVAEIHGEGARPPVVLLHGGGQTRHAWKKTAQVLAGHGLDVVNLDLRGHGESAWADEDAYRFDDFAGDLRAVIATLPAPPVIIGASLGGISAMIAAGEAPYARIAALVLVDITPHFEESGNAHVVGFMQATRGGFDDLDAAADAIAAYLPHRPRPASREGLAKNLIQREDGRYYWRWDPAFIRPREGWDAGQASDRLWQAVGHIDAPVMLVRGTQSEIVPDSVVDRFRQALPNAAIADVPNARHMVAGDDNDGFLEPVIDFVTRHAYRENPTHG